MKRKRIKSEVVKTEGGVGRPPCITSNRDLDRALWALSSVLRQIAESQGKMDEPPPDKGTEGGSNDGRESIG